MAHAELVGIVRAWAWVEGYRVVSDSQLAIKHCLNQASEVQLGGSGFMRR